MQQNICMVGFVGEHWENTFFVNSKKALITIPCNGNWHIIEKYPDVTAIINRCQYSRFKNAAKGQLRRVKLTNATVQNIRKIGFLIKRKGKPTIKP